MTLKLTTEQHIEYGEALKAATEATVKLQSLLSNAYGKTCRERTLADKANTALLHLRSGLDSRACSENPSDNALRYYFGERIAKTAQSA